MNNVAFYETLDLAFYYLLQLFVIQLFVTIETATHDSILIKPTLPIQNHFNKLFQLSISRRKLMRLT